MPKTERFAFACIAVLFFLFGFITCLNDILVPHFKSLFDLNYRQSMMIQFCFFSAYLVFSYPSGFLVRKFGYTRGILMGLAILGLGALGFLPAGYFHSYELFLASLFVMACGIALIQVAGNPYAAALGPSESAPLRLNLVGAFNSLGTSLAPILGSVLILSVAKSSGVQSTALPYLGIAGAVVLLAMVFSKLRLPVITDEVLEAKLEDASQDRASPWDYAHLRMGVLGIFFYVGAEVSLGSILVNYIMASWGLEASQAGHYVAVYWTLAMLGRFSGYWFLKNFRAADCLFNAAVLAVTLVTLGMLSGKAWSPYCFMLVGFVNSIMFPVTFTLSIDGLGRHTSKAASYLCMAIVGGAFLPLAQGWISDHVSLRAGFLVPLLGYFYLCWFAWRMRTRESAEGRKAAHEILSA